MGVKRLKSEAKSPTLVSFEVHLHRWVSSAVKDLTGLDLLYLAHCRSNVNSDSDNKFIWGTKTNNYEDYIYVC